jgi:hypothetical protein
VLKYIERKSGYGDDGPAWIARVSMSKSGRTVYFKGMALKRLYGRGVSGNHYDLQTGDEYWVSGVKTRGSNRHWVGSGVVMIEAGAVDEYLEVVGRSVLDESGFRVIADLPETDPALFCEVENRTLER